MSRKFEPDEHQRFKVAVMMKCGFTLEETAREIGVDIKTLKKTCKREIKEGKRIFLARLEMKLSQKALAGDTVAMLFVMKCQKGWRETARLEMTGADGKPIEPPRLGISFEMGGPGIVRKTPYNMDADPNLHLPPGSDRLASPGDEPVKVPATPALAPPEPVTMTEAEFKEIERGPNPQPAPPPAPKPTTLEQWAVLGMSPEEFARHTGNPLIEEDWGQAMANAVRGRRVWGGSGSGGF